MIGRKHDDEEPGGPTEINLVRGVDRRERAAEHFALTVRRREEAAAERDQLAALEDEHAAARDQAARLRDREAESRDLAALSVEALEALKAPPEVFERLSMVRREAAADRRAAAAGRLLASADRARAAADRAMAALDREAAAKDRSSTVFDDLTGAYQRGPGFVEVAREVARAKRTRQPLVLAFIDVDDLKAVNDAEGHGRGDDLLRAVAAALRSAVRVYDPVVRYGGDEFICVLSGLDLAAATQRLATVNVILAEGHQKTSVSAGLAELRPDDSLSTLIDRADAALYEQRARRPPKEPTPRPHASLDHARRDAGLSHMALWLRYFELGGMAVPLQLEAFVTGASRPTSHEHGLIVDALNERFAELGRGSPVRH
jgi:diguanylate cyclase (GGDEF)-like protein